MSAAAGGFPSWALLEPFVFRRDNDESFPDESEAPIRASATTSWGADIRISFSVAEPPRISRLYAQLPEPGFPPKESSVPLVILATHRHLALLSVSTYTPSGDLVQNLFVFRANQINPSMSSLQAIPPCTEPELDYYSSGGDDCPPSDATPHLLEPISLGLWCGDEEEEFVVAELTLYIPSYRCTKAFADICMLRGHCTTTTTTTTTSGHHLQLGGTWNSMRVEILSSTDNPADADLWQLCCWQTDTAIAFQRWLCWIDYHQGILFCDMSNELPAPTVSFLRFPVLELDDKSPLNTSTHTSTTCNIWYSGVSIVDRGRVLKFANVTHHDTFASREPKPGTGFTITCHTLVLGGGGGMAWEEDYTVTSDDLRDANLFDSSSLRCGTLKFPRVDIDRPHVLHFLSVGFGANHQKMWVVSINMSTKTVESSHLYINGMECLPTDDNHFIIKKLTSPLPFLPCEFPRFCYLSRERKDDVTINSIIDSVSSPAIKSKVSIISEGGASETVTLQFGSLSFTIKQEIKKEEENIAAVVALPCNVFIGAHLKIKKEASYK